MGRVEASLFELLVIHLSLRRESHKAPKELVITGFFALLQQGLGMIGVFKVAMAVVASGMASDQLVLIVEAEPVGIGFEGQSLSG
jgi:hypothetical protein